MNSISFTVYNPRTATDIAYVAAAQAAMGNNDAFKPWSCTVKIQMDLYVQRPAKKAPLPLDLCKTFDKVRLACCGVVYDKASRVIAIGECDKLPTEDIECVVVTISKV